MAHFVKAHGQLIATEFGLLCFDYVTVNLYMFVLVAYFTPTFTSVSMLESLQEKIQLQNYVAVFSIVTNWYQSLH